MSNRTVSVLLAVFFIGAGLFSATRTFPELFGIRPEKPSTSLEDAPAPKAPPPPSREVAAQAVERERPQMPEPEMAVPRWCAAERRDALAIVRSEHNGPACRIVCSYWQNAGFERELSLPGLGRCLAGWHEAFALCPQAPSYSATHPANRYCGAVFQPFDGLVLPTREGAPNPFGEGAEGSVETERAIERAPMAEPWWLPLLPIDEGPVPEDQSVEAQLRKSRMWAEAKLADKAAHPYEYPRAYEAPAAAAPGRPAANRDSR